jgi:hypothetical protein
MADALQEFLSVVEGQDLTTQQPQTETDSSYSDYYNTQQLIL